MLALGLQRKSIEEVEGELALPVSQALAMFVKVVRKVVKRLEEVQKEGVRGDGRRGVEMMDKDESGLEPAMGGTNGSGVQVDGDSEGRAVAAPVRQDGAHEEDEETRARREKQRELIQALDLTK
jgi:N-acetyltransferase 10